MGIGEVLKDALLKRVAEDTKVMEGLEMAYEEADPKKRELMAQGAVYRLVVKSCEELQKIIKDFET